MKFVSSMVCFLNARMACTILCCVHLPILSFGQYTKNPLMPITKDGYKMTMEKFVKIPDDYGLRPRINSFTFYGDRIFVATEIGGKIYEIVKAKDNSDSAALFFDVAKAIFENTGRNLNLEGGWHTGLRSVAFHPEFNINGKFYTSLMEDRPDDITGHHYLSDDPSPIQADGVVLEWTYDFENDTIYSSSYRELFRVGMPVFDHTIKEVAFNRYAQPGDEDYGLLYITHGDGSIQSATAGGGQKNDALGKVLRINPLQSGESRYTIPASNPFVGDAKWLDEIYSVGHRNPHTICFAKDSLGKVNIIVGEAGRDNMEEVNVIEKGGNYGWSQRDGTYVHLAGGGIQTGIAALPSNEASKGYIFPSAQWTHTGAVGAGFVGQAIAGGYVYTIPETKEQLYLCADFAISSRVFHANLYELEKAVTKLDPGNTLIDSPEELTQAHLGEFTVLFDNDKNINTPAIAKTSMKDIINDEANYDSDGDRGDLRFGQDKDEKVYIMNKRNGWIYKIQSITKSKAPVLASIESTQLSFTGGDAIITETTTVEDEDNTKLTKATVKITGNYNKTEDKLVFTKTNGITGAWASSTGTLTLTGSATIAAYQTALRTVTYSNSNIVNPSTLTRAVSFTVNDGSLNSNSLVRNIEIDFVPEPQAPVLAAMEGTTVQFIKGDGPINVTSSTTVNDLDDTNLSNATVQITENYVSTEDVLAFENANGIIGSWTSGTGVLSLTGSANVAAYQTALRSITYQNTNETNPSTLNRKVSFTVNDGSLNSNSVDRTIEVTINTGLDKYENAQFSAYPNPVSKDEILHLSFSTAPKQSADVYIVDIAGRNALLGKVPVGQNTMDIDLSANRLSNGYYIIHIYLNDTHVAYPLIIK